MRKNLVVLCSIVALLTICSGVTYADPIYTIGNATPASSFFIQGQSFTPSIQGNDGSGSPAAGASGTVFLLDFSLDFVDPNTAPNVLYIFAAPPTLADAASGAGSLGAGTYLGGGVYDFGSGVELDFLTKYFAVLPFSTSIFDGSGNLYVGGVDMFPTPIGNPTHVTEGFGAFDAGFNATFAPVPEPSLVGLIIVGAGMRFAIRRRRSVRS